MTHPKESKTDTLKPDYVTALEAAYGPPSQAGFGSAIFYDLLPVTSDLTEAALARYRFFVGDLWERYGEAAWMGPWQQLYTRPLGASRDVVAELRALEDREARQSASMIVDEVVNAEAVLATAFDDPDVTEMSVYKLGDGGAMSGLLVAALRSESAAGIFLVFLLD